MIIFSKQAVSFNWAERLYSVYYSFYYTSLILYTLCIIYHECYDFHTLFSKHDIENRAH